MADQNRRDFMKQTASGVAALSMGAAAAKENGKPPNIVFVFADQLRTHDLGCYGGAQIATPNIDHLAAEGVRFTNAISTYPICSPYRAMLLTGCYPMRNGMICNDHFTKPGIPSFAQACNHAGYHTGYIGKWHIDGHGRTAYIPPERRLGFQHFEALECTHNYFKSMYYAGDSDTPRFWEGYDAVAQTEAAAGYIQQRAKLGPFALFLSWGPPHDPYLAPEEYMQRVSADSVTLRPNAEEHALADALLDKPRFTLPEEFMPIRKRLQPWLRDDAKLRKALAGYLAAILCLDDCLGRLRDTLDEEGVLDNTVFVFASDHGDCLGSHRFYGKDTPFEESISVPLLIRYPAKIPAGTVTDALTEPVDIMPTLLGLAGVPCPDVDGLDVSGAARGAADGPRDASLLMGMTHFCNASVISGMDTWRGVRTQSHTYVRYEDGTPWFFYDNEADPYQMQNLAADPSAEALRQKLDARLDDLLRQAGDPEDTRALYERIIQENPKHGMLEAYRRDNPARLG